MLEGSPISPIPPSKPTHESRPLRRFPYVCYWFSVQTLRLAQPCAIELYHFLQHSQLATSEEANGCNKHLIANVLEEFSVGQGRRMASEGEVDHSTFAYRVLPNRRVETCFCTRCPRVCCDVCFYVSRLFEFAKVKVPPENTPVLKPIAAIRPGCGTAGILAAVAEAGLLKPAESEDMLLPRLPRVTLLLALKQG